MKRASKEEIHTQGYGRMQVTMNYLIKLFTDANI